VATGLVNSLTGELQSAGGSWCFTASLQHIDPRQSRQCSNIRRYLTGLPWRQVVLVWPGCG